MAALRRTFHSLVFKNILSFVVILTLIVVPLVVIYLRDVEQSLSDTLASELTVVAERGRALVDAPAVSRIIDMHWVGSPEYTGLVRTLARIQREFSVDNVLVYRRLPDSKFVYVADSRENFSINERVALHERFPGTYEAANEAWETGRLGETRIFRSGSQKWFQINMPLKLDGRVVAVLMLNKFATPIAQDIESRQQRIIIVFSLAMAAGIALLWIITSRRLGPLVRLTSAAREIAGGNLDIRIPRTRSRSEIGQLNAAFSVMVDDLKRSRERIEQYNRELETRIEEQHRVEEALRTSEEKFRRLIEGSVQGIMLLHDGIVLFANLALAEDLGYGSVEELTGLNVWESVVLAEERDAHRTHQQALMAGDSVPHHIETRFRRRDGAVIWVEGILARVVWEGNPALQITTTDITERKQAREQLLEKETALRAAEESARLKDEFLASISHELRSPLTSVIGFADLIPESVRTGQGDAAVEYSGYIGESARHLKTIIDDLLDFAKIEAGEMSMVPEPLEIDAVLGQLEPYFAADVKEKGLSLEIAIPPSLPPVNADHTRTNQILINLISNAVKFTPNGGSIRVTVEKLDALQITVSDTGYGIAPEDLDKIFDRFQQVGRNLHEQQGTGLGLAITRRLVEMQGGRIWVESEPGAGSAFHFTIPFHVA